MGLHYQDQKHTRMMLSLHASADNTACTSCKPVGGDPQVFQLFINFHNSSHLILLYIQIVALKTPHIQRKSLFIFSILNRFGKYATMLKTNKLMRI